MRGLASARGVGSATLGVALLAAMWMLAASTSQADPEGGRGSGRGAQSSSRGGHGDQSGGGRAYKGEGRARGGGEGRAYKGEGRARGGGEGRAYKGEGRAYGGGGGRAYKGEDRAYGGGRGHGFDGGRSYGGGGRPSFDGGGRAYGHRGGSAYGGRRQYGGGYFYQVRPRYFGSYRRHYAHPRTVIRFGIGLGLPYYYPPAYRYHAVPDPIDRVESGIEVANEPPAGCYYYDRFCDREFTNLDDYTEHVENEDHAQTIEIIDEDSGDTLRTLEFVDGYWSVRK